MSKTADKSAARRFYGRRFGRALRAGRRRLLNELLPTLQIASAKGTLDPATLFQNSPKEYCLEIGFGGGEHLAAQAVAYPDRGFIGCEPFVNGVARLLSEIDEKKLRNIRIYPDNARDLSTGYPLIVSTGSSCCFGSMAEIPSCGAAIYFCGESRLAGASHAA